MRIATISNITRANRQWWSSIVVALWL